MNSAPEQQSPSVVSKEIVILGVTESGAKFRPSDWSDRLCGMMSIFSEDRHLSYSPYLKPIVADDMNCVVVDRKLEAIDAVAFRFLMDFVRDNELRTRPGRDTLAPTDQPGQIERRPPEVRQEASACQVVARLGHRLDRRSKPALIAACHVLVHDSLSSGCVQNAGGGTQRQLGRRLVTVFDGLAYTFNRRTHA